MKLSVGIITFNEDRIIGKTLEAIKEIADEIIIVDSYSQDKTVEIAKSYEAKIYSEEWKGFGPQKNSVIDKCSGEWILLIDADEVVSPELSAKIKTIIDGNNEYSIYKINRCCVCFGKELKHGGWSNQYAVRLWKNGAVRIDDKLVHEGFVTNNKIGKIKEKIYHYTYLTLHDYFIIFNKYTTLAAKEYFRRDKKASILKIIFNPLFTFIKMYMLRLGFLDGVEGLMIASSSALYTMVKYFKLREMYKNNSSYNKF